MVTYSLEALTPRAYDETRVLFDFTVAEDREAWTLRSQTRMEPVKDGVAVTYERFEAGLGLERWPAIFITRNSGRLGEGDFSGYDTLVVELYNPMERPNDPSRFSIHLRDGKDSRVSLRSVVVYPGEVRRVEVPLRQYRRYIDISDINQVHLYANEPEEDFTLELRRIELGITVLEEAEGVLERAREDLERAGRVRGGNLRAVQARALVSEAEAFVEGLRETPPAGSHEVEAARRHAEELGVRALRVSGRVSELVAGEDLGIDGVGLGLVPVSPMKHVHLRKGELEGEFASSVRLHGAGREYVSVQVAVFPFGGDLEQVRWELSDLVDGAGNRVEGTVRVLGYVKTQAPLYPVRHVGWWPDPLLDFLDSIEEVPRDEVGTLWVTFEIPAEAPAGTYEGNLEVSGRGIAPRSLGIRMEVHPFTLPERPSLPNAPAFSDGWIRQLYPDRAEEMVRIFEDWFVGEYKLNPGTIYSRNPPDWSVERLREFREMGMTAYPLFYVHAPRGEDFDARDLDRRLEAKIERARDHLVRAEEAGVRELTYIYTFDERPHHEVEVVYGTAARLEEEFPDIPRMTTAFDRNFGTRHPQGEMIDMWVPLTPRFDIFEPVIRRVQQKGTQVWWYICLEPYPPYANWFIESDPVEARLLTGAMAASYRPDGLLYYSTNRWPDNDAVIAEGPRTSWNPASYGTYNGDGCIMLPGPNGPLATQRLENVRLGMQDYEYYQLLAELVGADHPEARVPDTLVKNLVTYTREPAEVEGERRRLAEKIIENL